MSNYDFLKTQKKGYANIRDGTEYKWTLITHLLVGEEQLNFFCKYLPFIFPHFKLFVYRVPEGKQHITEEKMKLTSM